MKKIGLVLCGGGAKGSYQVGVFKALEELGLSDQVCAISGSSIGAINGALFVQYTPYEIEGIWKSSQWPLIFGVSKENTQRLNQIIHSVNSKKMPPMFGLMNLMGVANTTGLPLKRDEFERSMKKYLNFSDIKHSDIELFVSCGKLNTKQQRYFNLNEQNPSSIKNILLASTAVPVIFNPVYLEGGYYCDPMQYENAPLAPLMQLDCDTIIIVYLDRRQRVNLSNLRGKQIIEIVPSIDLGSGIYGSLDFRFHTINRYIDVGCDDAYHTIYNALRRNPKAPRFVKIT